MKIYLNGYDADIYVYGHTHCKNVMFGEKKIYINPGSLGCPFDSDFAYSGVLEINDNKTIYTSVDIEYDVMTVTKEIQEKNYSMCEKIIDIFFGGRRM